LRFFHQGQFEGFQKRISPHLGRGPAEATDERLASFYQRLLAALQLPALRNGKWQLVECAPAWEGNGSHDSFVVFAWHGCGNSRLIVAVNFAEHQSQCKAQLPFGDLAGQNWRLCDQLSDTVYHWNGADISHGLFLDMQPWQAAVYVLQE
jgi:hypothetical protein